MTTVRKAWFGMMLLSAGVAAAVTYRARRPDYEAVFVPELTLCQVFEYGAGRKEGDFSIRDCKTGKAVTAIYVVDGRALSPAFVSWQYGGSGGDLAVSQASAGDVLLRRDSTGQEIQLTGDVTSSGANPSKDGRRGTVWPQDQDADVAFYDVCGKGATAFRKAGGSCAVLP